MYANVIDLTHDVLPERMWKAIRYEPDKVPPANIIKDVVLLRDWEQTLINDFHSYFYDRRIIEIDVFKKL